MPGKKERKMKLTNEINHRDSSQKGAKAKNAQSKGKGRATKRQGGIMEIGHEKRRRIRK